MTLDHQQRLNLIAVLGAYQTKGREQHAIWHLQDMLDLNSEEQRKLHLVTETTPDGQTRVSWDPAQSLPPREFDLSSEDLTLIQKALDEFPTFQAWRDRKWMEAIYSQLPASKNGSTGGANQ